MNLIKKSTLFLLINLFVGFSVSSQNFPTAAELAKDMTIGWNLGNTLEATGGETNWGNALTTQRLIDSVKAAGFNTVRIPCAWNQYANQSNNQITAQWMARVKEVVDYCVRRDLYVIINIHWDNGWLEENCTLEKQAENNIKQAAFWTQIATTFKDYDERLLFASANEPHVADATEMAVLLSYHQTCINTVRATGGNNAERIIIVQGPATDIEKTNDLMNTMPTDVSPGRLMAEVHFYPYQFSLMDADESWGKQFYYWGKCNHSTTDTDRNPTWGEEDFVDEMFQLMKTQFVDKGYPVILGEFGVKKRTNLSGAKYDLHIRSREYFLKYVVKSALNHGIIPVYWCAGLGELFNRNTGAILERGTVNALMAGAYSSAATVNCSTNDCKEVAYGHAYTNDCNSCVLGFDPTCSSAIDCNGVEGGLAYLDDCAVCVGGTTGKEPNTTCSQDCNNDWDGSATLDNCKVCSGGKTGIEPNSTCPQPCNVVLQDQTICAEGIVELTIDEAGNYAWYTNENDTEPIETGASYSPFIDATTTLYVERETKQTTRLGETNKTGEGWGDNTFANDDKKMKITVTERVSIKAVHVFTTIENTEITLRITSLAGNKIGEGSVTAPSVGKTKVDLNVGLEPGEYLIDAVGTTESLFYQNEKGIFPYSIEGVVSFTYNASWASTWYGFFYDWEIEQGKSCIKTPVTITLDPQDVSCGITGTRSILNTESEAYPNPFTTHLNLNVQDESDFVIYNSYGVRVLSGDCSGSCLIGEELKSGVYHLVITDKTNITTKVIVKQ